MEDFSASLVREKIIFISDHDPEQSADAEETALPPMIRSNRIMLKVGGLAGTEKIVLRAQNMHSTLRLANRVMTSYYKNGLFLDRPVPPDWEAMWQSVLSNYEKEFNPDTWCAVYINGRPMYKTSASPFVDVIEKCALLTLDNYDATMEVTETALKQIGRAMRLEHSSNVAAIFSDEDGVMRCGIMQRGNKGTTFSFTASGGGKEERICHSLGVAAVFLEGMNLRFIMRELNDMQRHGEFEKGSVEARKLRAASARMAAVAKGITLFESTFKVHYRPEKPMLFGSY